MTTSVRGAIHVVPRIFGILFAAFLSVFALDVFDGSSSGAELVMALAAHLVPSFVVLAIVALAWKREMVGVVGFALLAATYVVAFRGRFPIQTYVAISGPLLLLSLLFFASWREGRSREPVPPRVS